MKSKSAFSAPQFANLKRPFALHFREQPRKVTGQVVSVCMSGIDQVPLATSTDCLSVDILASVD